jgi:hypothetical protein
VKFKTVRDFVLWNSANKPGSQRCVAQKARFLPISSGRSALGREFGAGLLRAVNDQTMRDSGDVCGARNTQFDQEFLGLFRSETVSVYDRRDRIGDLCVAEYLAKLDTVHLVRYSTPFSLHLGRTTSRPPNQRQPRRENALPASATESVAKSPATVRRSGLCC